MSHLQPVPKPSESDTAAHPLTVFSPDSREVVYLEDEATIEVITAALQAWGLRVRSERQTGAGSAKPKASVAAEPSWTTTRPPHPAPGRLENILSPLWLPIRRPVAGNEPVVAWSWFGQAA